MDKSTGLKAFWLSPLLIENTEDSQDEGVCVLSPGHAVREYASAYLDLKDNIVFAETNSESVCSTFFKRNSCGHVLAKVMGPFCHKNA